MLSPSPGRRHCLCRYYARCVAYDALYHGQADSHCARLRAFRLCTYLLRGRLGCKSKCLEQRRRAATSRTVGKRCRAGRRRGDWGNEPFCAGARRRSSRARAASGRALKQSSHVPMIEPSNNSGSHQFFSRLHKSVFSADQVSLDQQKFSERDAVS